MHFYILFFTSALSYTYIFQLHQCNKYDQQQYNIFIGKFVEWWVLLTSAPGAFFKHSKKSNYSLKKSNISIFKALITCIFIHTYYLWSLTSGLLLLLLLLCESLWTNYLWFTKNAHTCNWIESIRLLLMVSTWKWEEV